MTPKQEAALRLAREALKLNCSSQTESPATKAITAIDEALAEQQSGIKQVIELYDSPEQPAQQEPVAYIRKDQLQKAAQSPVLCEVTPEPRQDRIGIYISSQPSKPWVEITPEELMGAANQQVVPKAFAAGAAWANAKLKEKNT